MKLIDVADGQSPCAEMAYLKATQRPLVIARIVCRCIHEGNSIDWHGASYLSISYKAHIQAGSQLHLLRADDRTPHTNNHTIDDVSTVPFALGACVD